jgi:hypothetical protein
LQINVRSNFSFSFLSGKAFWTSTYLPAKSRIR